MKRAVIYEKESGAIKRTVSAPLYSELIKQKGEGEGVFVLYGAVDLVDKYVGINGISPLLTSPVMIDKTDIISNGFDCVTLTGAPIGSKLFIDGESSGVTTDLDPICITFDTPGVYFVSLKSPKFKDYEVLVNAS